MSGIGRVIVGASGSPGSLRALRYAEEVARAQGATLIPALAWIPPGGDLADRRAPCGYLRGVWAEDARRRLREILHLAWGQIPACPPVRPFVQRGEAGVVLVDAACRPDDLLVVGAGRHGRLGRVIAARVSRYCLAHACCPVLAIPPPAAARELGHRPLGWVFWRRPLTPDQVLNDRGTAAA